MGIERPEGPGGMDLVAGIARTAEPDTAAGAPAVEAAGAAAPGDAVTRVAEELAAGRISGDEAVEILLREVLEDGMVQGAPESIRVDLAEALAALLATDPHLVSLARSLGANPES